MKIFISHSSYDKWVKPSEANSRFVLDGNNSVGKDSITMTDFTRNPTGENPSDKPAIPEKSMRDAQLDAIEASLLRLNSICSAVGVRYRGLHGSQANAQSFAVKLATCPDESAVRRLTTANPEEAEAFLGLAHSFLSKLRVGHFSSEKPPETAATPFFQIAKAVDEACDLCAQTGNDLWDDWDTVK